MGFPSSSTQSHPLCLLPLLQEHPAKEPPPAPPALPQGGQIQGAALRPRLHVPGGGERGSGGAQVIFGCGRRSAREGSDQEQLQHLLFQHRPLLQGSAPQVPRSQDLPLHLSGTQCLLPSVPDQPPLRRATTKTTTFRRWSPSSSPSLSPPQPRWFPSSSSTPPPDSRGVSNRSNWRTMSPTTTASMATAATTTAVE